LSERLNREEEEINATAQSRKGKAGEEINAKAQRRKVAKGRQEKK
jgi:hypothetical protein